VAGQPQEYFQELPSTLRPATPRDYVGLVPDPVVREVLSAPGVHQGAESSAWPYEYPTWQDYLAWVTEEGTTSNGVFGAKVMWRYFGGLLLRLREAFGRGHDLALLDHAFGPPAFVFLRRADKLGQAVSLWRAIQTWSWRADDGRDQSVEAVYSFAAIDHLIRRLELDEADWERWFQTVGADPHRLEYEQLAGDYAQATLGVLAFVGAAEDVRFDGLPPLRRQADGTSEHWAEQYRSDLERRQMPEMV